jgi:uncharacterized membrane protein YccC
MPRWRDPVTWSNVSQLLKTAAAAVIAWMLARHVFGIAQPFLAPWAAVLTLHATVYGTLRRGAQQVGATFAGVLLAFAAGKTFGVDAISVGAVVALGLLVGSVRAQRTQATTAAVTALVVLTAGYSDDGGMLAARLLDTGIGIAIGLLVNLLVWPPLRDRGAARQIGLIDDRIGELLCEMAATLQAGREPAVDDWIERTNDLDGDIDEAWRVLGQARESGRLNPRRGVSERMRAASDFETILRRLEQAVAETRSMATTIGLAHEAPELWDPWLELLHATADAVAGADAGALKAVRAELDELAGGTFRPITGALIVNLRNIIESLDVVADAQPVEVRAPSPLSA